MTAHENSWLWPVSMLVADRAILGSAAGDSLDAGIFAGKWIIPPTTKAFAKDRKVLAFFISRTP